MNEAETRAELIDPALKAAGWGVIEGSRIRREVIVRGRLLVGFEPFGKVLHRRRGALARGLELGLKRGVLHLLERLDQVVGEVLGAAVGLFDAAGWKSMLDDALRETGGSLTKAERKWADALLHSPQRKPERRKASGSRSTGKNRAA